MASLISKHSSDVETLIIIGEGSIHILEEGHNLSNSLKCSNSTSNEHINTGLQRHSNEEISNEYEEIPGLLPITSVLQGHRGTRASENVAWNTDLGDNDNK